MILYLDTSALVKLFVEEAHSPEVRTVARLAGTCATSRIAYVEFLSALARREREGLNAETAQGLRESFEAGWLNLMVVEVNRGMTIRAAGFARVHALRAYDAVHLACAQEIQEAVPELVFACFDERLNQVAQMQGMRVL
jgi:predicted nucleic acid-binding protein